MPTRTARKVKQSKALVIDASVIRAAGSIGATDPVPAHCRDFLKTALDVCHTVRLDDDLWREWQRHLPRYARTWLQAMHARRKVIRGEVTSSAHLQIESRAETLSDRDRTDFAKDMHLVRLALDADQIVVSLDTRMQAILKTVASRGGVLNDLLWIDPVVHFVAAKAWLEGTGTADGQWLIGQTRELAQLKNKRRRER